MNQPKIDSYIQANRSKVEAIKTVSAEIIDMMNPYIAVKEGEAASLRVIQGEPTPEEIYTSYKEEGKELTTYEAYDIAEYQSFIFHKMAEMAILGAQSSITMLRLSEYYDQHSEVLNLEGRLLPYAKATYAAIEAQSAQNEHVRLSHTWLEGLEGNNSASFHEIAVNDGILIRSLAIASLGNAIRNIRHSVRPAEDELIQRTAAILHQTHMTQVVSLLSRPTHEAEIDKVLGTIWQEYRGSGLEGEIAPLLNDLRQRALDAQRARDIGQEDGTGLPNVDKLNEFGRLVGIV